MRLLKIPTEVLFSVDDGKDGIKQKLQLSRLVYNAVYLHLCQFVDDPCLFMYGVDDNPCVGVEVADLFDQLRHVHICQLHINQVDIEML